MMFRTGIREVTAAEAAQIGRFHRVFNARAPNVMPEDLPCLKVWTPDDNADNLSIGNPELRGNCALNMQIVIEGVEDEANARYIDDLSESLIHFFLEHPVWLRLFDRVLSVNQTIEANTEGDMRVVTNTMVFLIQYGQPCITRIIDYLDHLRMTVPVPEQPEPPAGEDEHTVEVGIDLPRYAP